MEAISDYTVAILLVTLHSNVSKMRFCNETKNMSVSLSTYTTGSTLLHLSIDFGSHFFEVGKNQLLTVDKMSHSSIPSRIFSAHIKTATQVHLVQINRLFEK
jgi:hypothetical protein